MPHRLLYVDDELDNLTAFKAVFRRHYDILLAESAEEAMRILETEEVALILSDQRMPKMTGVAFFDAIKDLYPNSIRMVITGYSDIQATIDAINKGKIYHYITKPWKAEELKIIIDRALESLELRKRNQELERQNIQSQFELLKNQINPHFLFNSMNILASLIPINPEMAVNFTRSFSKLYRSVLQVRGELVISLADELEFVKDYFTLQKMRFDENLQLAIEIPTEQLQHSLPPFALQILVENAVKHNIIADDHPLKINIFTEGDNLFVINNYQPRHSGVESTGLGLNNLKARYKLLGLNNIIANQENGHFMAKIPLIPNT